MAESDESPLRRWSRRKHEATRAQAEPPPAESAPPAPAAPEVRVEDLPDVESLTYESDFTAFLGANVPEELKRRALRKLWRSNPLFADLDGLNDYDPAHTSFLIQEAPVVRIAREAVDRMRQGREPPRERPPAGAATEDAAQPAPRAAAEPPPPDPGGAPDPGAAPDEA